MYTGFCKKVRFLVIHLFDGLILFLYKSFTACILNKTSPLPFGLSPIAQTCVIFLQDCTSFARGEVGTHIDRYRSLIMPLRFVRQLRTQMAQSLVLSVKFGAQRLAAVAARVPSSKGQSSSIRTLRISVR